MSLQNQLAISDEHWKQFDIRECLKLFEVLCPGYSNQVSKVSLMYYIDEYGNLDNEIVQAILKSLDTKDKIEILQYLGELQ